jgi:hypothetical protein
MVVRTGYTCARKFIEYLFYFYDQERERFSYLMEQRVHYCTITSSVTAFAHIVTCSGCCSSLWNVFFCTRTCVHSNSLMGRCMH